VKLSYIAALILLVFVLVVPFIMLDVSTKAKNSRPETEIIIVPTQTNATDDTGLVTSFWETGTLLQTDKQSNLWSILYETPGAPALKKNLIFNAKSKCDKGDGVGPCQVGNLQNGTRVQIQGTLTGGQVMVVLARFSQ